MSAQSSVQHAYRFSCRFADFWYANVGRLRAVRHLVRKEADIVIFYRLGWAGLRLASAHGTAHETPSSHKEGEYQVASRLAGKVFWNFPSCEVKCGSSIR